MSAHDSSQERQQTYLACTLANLCRWQLLPAATALLHCAKQQAPWPAVLAAGAAVAGNGDGYGMTDSHHFGQPSVTYRSNATASYGGQGAYGSDYPGYGGAPAAPQLQPPPRQQAAAPTPGSPYGQRSPHSGGAAAGYGAPAAGEPFAGRHTSSCTVCCMETRSSLTEWLTSSTAWVTQW